MVILKLKEDHIMDYAGFDGVFLNLLILFKFFREVEEGNNDHREFPFLL